MENHIGLYPGGWEGGYSDIFIYVVSGLFWPQNFEFQYFWDFQTNEDFGGMKILWIFLGIIHIVGL